MDKTQKLITAVLLGAVVYLIFTVLFSALFQPRSMFDMMRFMQGGAFGGIYSTLNLISLILAIGAGIFLYYLIPEREGGKGGVERGEGGKTKAGLRKRDKLRILRQVLSDDEKKILREVKKAKGITQDSLRFRLGWSKAKISAVLGRLDRARIIQRRREGKTYKLFLQR